METLPKLILASKKRQNNKQQAQLAINWSKATIETLLQEVECVKI